MAIERLSGSIWEYEVHTINFIEYNRKEAISVSRGQLFWFLLGASHTDEFRKFSLVIRCTKIQKASARNS